MSTMIEKIARASFDAWQKRMLGKGWHKQSHTFEELSESEREFAFMHARAVVEAMKEPTDNMVVAGEGETGYRAYEAMLKAALKEGN